MSKAARERHEETSYAAAELERDVSLDRSVSLLDLAQQCGDVTLTALHELILRLTDPILAKLVVGQDRKIGIVLAPPPPRLVGIGHRECQWRAAPTGTSVRRRA